MIKRVLSLVLIIVLAVGVVPFSAYAAGTPGINDIEKYGLEESIQLPDDESYLENYDEMYATGNLQVLSYTQSGKSKTIDTVKAGDRVTLIAKQKNYGCVLYKGKEGEGAGWVPLEKLSYNDPDKKLKAVSAKTYTGAPSEKDIADCGLRNAIQMPEEDAYTAGYDRMYVFSGDTKTYSSVAKNLTVAQSTLAKGSEVTVIALGNSYACILFETDCGTKAGWIQRDSLRYNREEEHKSVSAVEHSGTPSEETFENLGLEKSITLPEDDSYTAVYDCMYVTDSSLPVLTFDGNGDAHTICKLFAGDEVNVIAIQNKLACIMFDTDEGEKIGWVYLSTLSYRNPLNKTEATIAAEHTGTPSFGDIKRRGMQKSMTLPDDEKYTSSYDRMYSVPAANPVYTYNEDKHSNAACMLYAGAEVNVIAIQNKLACILYDSDEGEKAGWVPLESLSYNNAQNKQKAVKAYDHEGVPSVTDIENVGMDKSMTLPDDGEYLSSFDRMYTTPSSLQVFSYNENKNTNIALNLYKGSEVNVIAIKNKYACILCDTDEGEKAGWVALDALSYNDVTRKYGKVSAKTYSGTPGVEDLENLGVDKSVTLPDEDSYLAVHEKMYVVPANVMVFTFNESDRKINACNLYAGSEVTVIAIQNKYALVILTTDEGEKAGWIALDALSYNSPDSKHEPRTVKSESGVPSYKTIEKLGQQNSMTVPDDDSYISSYEKMYTIPSALSVNSFSKDGTNICSATLYEGSEVYVIAVQKKYACILFDTDEGEKAGWVPLDSLRFNNPLNKSKATEASKPSGKPSIETIEKLGQDKSMTIPNDSYLDEFAKLYVKTGSLPVYSFCESKISFQSATLDKGSVVFEIARQKDYACVVYESDTGTKAGWVLFSGLSEEKPK